MGKLLNDITPIEEIPRYLDKKFMDSLGFQESDGERMTRELFRMLYWIFRNERPSLKPKEVFQRPSRSLFKEYVQRINDGKAAKMRMENPGGWGADEVE